MKRGRKINQQGIALHIGLDICVGSGAHLRNASELLAGSTAMDWWLNTIGNSLQIIASIAVFGAAIQWGRSIMKDHEIATILIATILGLSVLVSTASLSERLGMLPIRKQEQVFNKHFNNEPVVLDDHEFYNCVFENVTIKYAGGSYRIENPKFVQPIKLQTTSLVAFRTVA